jgi:Tol biopolymer transport system component
MRLVAVVGVAVAVLATAASSRPLPTAYASPSWSPDGRELVFLSARGPKGGIVVSRADGTNRRRLARVTIPTQVAWSPAGDRIAYVADDGLSVIGSGGMTQWTVEPAGDPAWSADGRELAFAAGEAGPIQVIGADGTARREVTSGRFDHAPSWSPDGRLLVFARAVRAGGPESIYVVGTDGTGVRPLGLQGSAPVWSPDGRTIAFWRRTPYGFEAAVASADGTSVRSLTRTRPAFSSPLRWSHDGKRLVFSLCPGLGACHVDVADVETGAVSTLATGDEPVWAPNGTRIAFAARRGCRSAGIFVMDADGRDVSRLTPCR